MNGRLLTFTSQLWEEEGEEAEKRQFCEAVQVTKKEEEVSARQVSGTAVQMLPAMMKPWTTLEPWFKFQWLRVLYWPRTLHSPISSNCFLLVLGFSFPSVPIQRRIVRYVSVNLSSWEGTGGFHLKL